jgi:hypothetical protein
MKYTDSQLRNLCQINPQDLIRLLNSPSIDAHTICNGTEILSEEISDEEIVLPILKQFLKHRNAIVREGALIGLTSFYLEKSPTSDILDLVKVISTNDPSPQLRDYASDIIKDFESR